MDMDVDTSLLTGIFAVASMLVALGVYSLVQHCKEKKKTERRVERQCRFCRSREIVGHVLVNDEKVFYCEDSDCVADAMALEVSSQRRRHLVIIK
jgi:hypothetical protein